jgi:membrane fusion protein (multidrug efflux system)
LTAYGTVEPAPATLGNPAAAARLAAAVPGVIAKINIAEGQHVEKGDVLMELDSSTIPIKYAEEEVERQEKLYAQQNTSQHNVQTARAQLAMLRVTAPLAGTLAHLNVTLGAAVDTTTVVAEIVDLNRLTLRAEIPTAEATELKEGQEASTLTDPPVSGPLSSISPTVDTNNGTVLTRMRLPPGSGLRPGQFIQLRLLIGTHENCLAAPAESVVTDIEGASVVEVVKGDVAVQTPVKTAFREDNWVEVDGSGLKEGDSVVTVGAYGLPDKTKIQVAPSSEAAASQTNSASRK